MYEHVWRDFRLPMSALATVARESFNGKFTAKYEFPIGPPYPYDIPNLNAFVKRCIIGLAVSIDYK